MHASDHSSTQLPLHLKRMTSLFEHVTIEKQQGSDSRASTELQQKRASTGSLVLTLNAQQRDPVIVHAEAVIAFLHLIAAVPHAKTAPSVSDLSLCLLGLGSE